MHALRHSRTLLLTIMTLAAPLLAAGSATATTCLGPAGCPFVPDYGKLIGQRGEGVLRFPQAIAISPVDGTVHVGDQNSHVIQVFTPQGQFVRQYGSPGTRAGDLTAVSGLAITPDGTVGVTDGGTNSVSVFAADGSHIRAFGIIGETAGQFRFGAGGGNDMPAGGAIAFAGNYWYVSDSGNDRVQRFTLDGSNPTVLIGPGRLAHPRGIAVRGTRILVADDHNHRIAVYDTGGRLLTTFGGQGSGPGKLNFPFGVATDKDGRVFVADDMNQRIVRFSSPPRYPYKARWGAYGTAPGRLAYPRALATSNNGDVYVTNTGNDRIDVFNRSGRLLRSFGRSGRAPGQFNMPTGVGSDPSGLRAVTDAINGRVVLLNPDGSVATIWGSPNPGPTILRRPVDVAFDPAGNGYVLDQRRSRILVFDRSTARSPRSIGSPGSGFGQLSSPSALARYGDGTLWVADTGNERIVKFGADGSPLGSFPTGARPRGVAISPDGTRIYVTTERHRVEVYDQNGDLSSRFGFGPGRRLSQFNLPTHIRTDAAGNLWIADRGNNRIVLADADGQRLSAFGERGSQFPEQFIRPNSIALDCGGRMTIADEGNNVVHEFLAANNPQPACAQLPAPAPAPELQYPTLPDPEGPLITSRLLRRTALLTRGIAVRVGCDVRCSLSPHATLTPRGLPTQTQRRGVTRPSAVSIRFVAKTVQIKAGASRIVRLRPRSQSDVRRLRRALAGKRGVTVSATFTAAGAVGDTTRTSLSANGTT